MPTNTPQRIGNYALDRRIGKGGMSEVWLAHHRSLTNRQVAVKLLLSQDQEWIDRFTREAELTSRLHHENIVQIYDHGFNPPSSHYTIMEFVSGGALRNVLTAQKSLPLDLAVYIFRCAGAALDYAHSQGVIHRDVSPGNILIEEQTSRVLLTDFGIAREAGRAGVTTINKVMGTPGYLSPEHASSATAVTHLSDLYGLGVVLYEMITGRLPWDHSPGMPDSSGGPFEPPRPLRDAGAQAVPAELDRVLQTLLAIDPTKRYPSAQAAVQDIERVLSRHTSKTQIVAGGTPGAGVGHSVSAPPAAPLPEPHPVETALGVDLLKGPMQEAEKHAAALTPEAIRRLLDEWSSRSQLRRRLLGRQANIHRITHTNVYFYTLDVLYETRKPIQTVEEPDHAAAPVPFEREIDRWSVELPEPKGFISEKGGVVRLPGSTRVTACSECSGVGKKPCPRCKGQGRVKRAVSSDSESSRPTPVNPLEKQGDAAPAAAVATKKTVALVPCPECGGAGGVRCEHCDGVGRMLEKKTTAWQRRAAMFESYDDLPNLDEQWLRKNCAMTEIYCERQLKDVRSEWSQVPELKELIDQAQDRWDADTRLALSEVSISFIPITEIVFDLGETRAAAPPPPDENAAANAPQPTLYSWYIYGFENKLPNDWRFLNWDRVLAVLAVGAALILLLYLVILLVAR